MCGCRRSNKAPHSSRKISSEVSRISLPTHVIAVPPISISTAEREEPKDRPVQRTLVRRTRCICGAVHRSTSKAAIMHARARKVSLVPRLHRSTPCFVLRLPFRIVPRRNVPPYSRKIWRGIIKLAFRPPSAATNRRRRESTGNGCARLSVGSSRPLFYPQPVA